MTAHIIRHAVRRAQDLLLSWASLPGWEDTHDAIEERSEQMREHCRMAVDLEAAMLRAAHQVANGDTPDLAAPWREHGTDYVRKQLRGVQHVVTLDDVVRWVFQVPGVVVALVRPLLEVLAVVAPEQLGAALDEVAPRLGRRMVAIEEKAVDIADVVGRAALADAEMTRAFSAAVSPNGDGGTAVTLAEIQGMKEAAGAKRRAAEELEAAARRAELSWSSK